MQILARISIFGEFHTFSISDKLALDSGGVRNDHNFLVFGPILINFGMESQPAPRMTPNEYDMGMAVFGQRLHRGQWPVGPSHMNISKLLHFSSDFDNIC